MYRIKTITVKELFGYAGNDYTVKLDHMATINFIYGFNGCGKTTLFKLVYGAFKISLSILDSISFKSIKITFDTGESLIVGKTINKQFDDITIGELPQDEIGYYFPWVYKWEAVGGDVREGKFYISKLISDNFSEALKEDFVNNSKLPFFDNMEAKKQVKFEELFITCPVDESISSSNNEFFRELAKKLNRIRSSIEILYANKDYDRFASLQRPRRKFDDGIHYEQLFENYDMLYDTVQIELEYAKKEIVKRDKEIGSMKDVSVEEWTSIRNGEVYDKEKKYVVFKIPDKSQFIKDKLKIIMDDGKAISFYFMPLEQMQEIREKQLLLFEELINKKPGLTDKDIFIDRSTGDIKVKMFGRDDVLLPMEKLSSGEKNWLLLHFYLIFFTNNNSIILIDEPEVSMHVDWQHSFANNIVEICKEKNIQIIIATHSPDVINENFLLMSEMKKIGGE